MASVQKEKKEGNISEEHQSSPIDDLSKKTISTMAG